MKAQVTKRRGRPPKDGEGKRTNFNTRLRNSLRAQLEKDASAAGRSLSEEIEVRLEQSLAKEAEEQKTWGGHRNMAAHHALAALVFYAAGVTGSPESWLHDPEIFEDIIKYWRASLKATGIAPALKDYPDDDAGAAEEEPR
jgi:Arc-like DNA binding domain